MSDRIAQRLDFLRGTDWSEWQQEPIAGDASRRSYVRLTSGEESVILMDAPPHSGEDLAPFIRIAGLLREKGLCPPRIHTSDQNTGFAVIEDLGPHHFAQAVDHGADERELYAEAARCIAAYADARTNGLYEMTPETGTSLVREVAEWFIGPERQQPLLNALRHILNDTYQPPALSLRDFHAENLIWRPHLTGTDRVGILDFQDALLAQPHYDLVSLLRDVRRDVSDAVVEELTNGIDQRSFAVTAVQRNLRILGIFHRLVRRDGKAKYAAFMPRVIGHLKRDLAHLDLSELRHIILPELDR